MCFSKGETLHDKVKQFFSIGLHKAFRVLPSILRRDIKHGVQTHSFFLGRYVNISGTLIYQGAVCSLLTRHENNVVFFYFNLVLFVCLISDFGMKYLKI